MNVLWTKQELHKILSKETVTVHAHASGDGCSAPSRCCRLCGGVNSLRSIGDTYVWEGVESRYDQQLYDCFGVTVSSPDCLICGCCVQQLKSTEQFRALVHAAFDKPASESTLKSEHFNELPKKFLTEHTYVVTEKELPKAMSRPQIISHFPNKKKNFKLKSALKKTCSLRRVNVACTICRQRYPAMVPKLRCENFICSRCKKKSMKTEVCRKCTLVVPENMMEKHLELHLKSDKRANSRLLSQRKTQQVRAESKPKTTLLPKYKCSECSKQFEMAVNLINHTKLNHGHNLKCVCAVCGKEFKNKYKLNVHLKEHTGPIFQCRNCMTAFMNNRALQTHSYRCKAGMLWI
ncbi:zinc finger protein 569 [Manduca sexta]|uniref:zinc finger protein 569 n=1 Tax=Manduca sexta TaxID=7130 RepID=UPI0018907ED5|nr:zinc finger protein 569 [Manduca sexta]